MQDQCSLAPDTMEDFLAGSCTSHFTQAVPGATRGPGRAAKLPPPRSSLASSHAPCPRPQIRTPGLVQQTLRARREHPARSSEATRGQSVVEDFRAASHDGSRDQTVCVRASTSLTPPSPWLRHVGEPGARVADFRCHITWEDPAIERLLFMRQVGGTEATSQ